MSEPSTVLVTGATGGVGRHVVNGLLSAGTRVRALTRRADLAGLPPDVEVVEGDLTDPATVEAAAKGADAAFWLWPSFSPDGAAAAVEALTRHVRQVVYLSAMNVRDDRPTEANLVWGAVEQLVEQSGTRWTFLRAGGFAKNTLQWAAQIRGGDVVRLPYPQARRSLIHERDIAAVAVRALLNDGHDGRTYVLTGPETLSQAAQVRAIGEAIGRPLRVEELPLDEARQQVAEQLGDHADSALAYWASLVDDPEPVTATVAEVTGRQARTFAAWAADHADDFRTLTAAEVAERYIEAFRTGRIDRAIALVAPGATRVAPLEYDGTLTGVNEIMANSRQLIADVRILAVNVSDPLVNGDRFAVRFDFEQQWISTGERSRTTKMSLYTVRAGRIAHEEVFYHTKP